MKRLRHAFAALLVLALTVAQPVQAEPVELCDFESVVIFATNSVQLGRGTTVTGDVVVNDDSSGPVLGESELSLDRLAIVHGDLKADGIDLDQASIVDGSVFFNQLSKSKGVTIVGGELSPLELPVFGDLPEFQPADVPPGADDVFVASGQTVTLGAAVPRVTGYGDVVVGAGAKVIFAGGGTFDVRSLAGSDIRFSAPTVLRIDGGLTAGSGAFIGPETGLGLSAADVVIHVGGAGELFAQPAAADFGSGSTVTANLYVPQGTLRFGQNANATGAFLARNVQVDRDSTFALASAFVNLPPAASPQEGTTSGTDPIVITLEGSDPEGGDLTFSIVAGEGPDHGSLSAAVTPIVPDPIPVIDRATGLPTGEFIQPPITRATVTYTPLGAGDLTDAFVFEVADVCGATDTAAVDVNPDDPETEPCPVVPVTAANVLADVTAGGSIGIQLDGNGPDCGGNLVYTITSLPSTGSIATSGGAAIESAPFALSDNVVVYTAGAANGTDSFGYEASETAGTAAATVTVDVGDPYELAPDSSASTNLNEPVLVTLIGLPGGSGSGGGPPIAGGSGAGSPRLGATGRSWGIDRTASVAAGNGELSGEQRRRLAGATSARTRAATDPAFLSPTAVGIDQGWVQFGWCDTATDPGCSNLTLDLVNESAAIEGPFTFTAPGPVCLSVVDTLAKGDHFRVEEGGQTVGLTSSPGQSAGATTGSADAAFNDPTYSSGSFELGAGSHSIDVIAIPPDTFVFGTAAYIRIDTGDCLPNLEVTAFSAPDTAVLDEPIGDQLLATVTNTGNVPIPAGTLASIGFYTSSDDEITTDDRLLSGGRENLSQQAPDGLTIGESVEIDLFSGASISSTFPDANPPAGDLFIGVLVDEFDLVEESDEGDNDAAETIEVLAESPPALVWEIQSISGGTLTDPATGLGVGIGQTFTIQPQLLFTPPVATSGTFTIGYQVTQGLVVDTAILGIVVGLIDQCVINGRDPGCVPSGGSFAPAGAGGGSAESDEVAPRARRDPLRGPWLIVEVVGAGSVRSDPLRFLGDRAIGLMCGAGGVCRVKFAAGSEVKLLARPDDGWEFAGWAGDCHGADQVIPLTLSSKSRCTAYFERVEK